MEKFLKCKVTGCGADLKPHPIEKAEREFEYLQLRGWCPYHDWQPLGLEEQEVMMAQLKR